MHPETSLEAFHSLDKDSIETQKLKILEALKVLGKATSEQVGNYLGMECWKRFSELERDEKIYNTKIKHKNKSGRNAFQYALRNADTVLPVTEKFKPGEKNIADYASAIIASTAAGKKLFQAEMFEEK